MMQVKLRVAALAAALVLVACSGDGPTPPQTAAGLYRLATVGGQPLPIIRPPSLGSGTMTHGDLLLRNDGTFALGMLDPTLWDLAFVTPGGWQLNGSVLRLTLPSGQAGTAGAEIVGALAGDSVVMTLESSVAYVFRRTAMPQTPLAAGTYALTSINDRTDLSFEYVFDGHNYAEHVLHDTITFHDGVFFRRSRAERFVSFLPEGDSLFIEISWATAGSYQGSAAQVVLRDYARPQSQRVRAVDTLAVGQNALMRRLLVTHPATLEPFEWEDIYTRLP